MSQYIDKRTFLAAVGCRAQGWYLLRADPEPITPGLEWRFYTGGEIGRLARTQLGHGILLPFHPEAIALEATARALGNSAFALLFEASFVWDAFAARADALRRDGDGWDIIEVKSGKAPGEGTPKDEYLDDLAFTVFVARAAGLSIARCLLMLIAPDYRGGDEADILKEIDVTDLVSQRASVFAQLAPELATALRSGVRPEPTLKLACRDCVFFETDCLGVGVPDPLFVLPRLSQKRFDELKGFGRISALPSDTKLSPAQERIVSVMRTLHPRVEPVGLAPLDNVVWPAYYLDFESVAPAVPWFDGASPYEAMPFQFSIHVCETQGRVVAHHEYLAPIEGDWRRQLGETLLAHLGDHGSVIMYSPYEHRMLSYLVGAVPDLEPQIVLARQRLFDLEPILREGYFHPAFAGRTSIKQVLPVMAPELSYGQLEIRGGDDAGGTFALMRVGRYGADTHLRHRESLLAYCKLDTLAMVRLHEELLRIRLEYRSPLLEDDPSPRS